jgi:hypothetical protein
MSIQEVLVDLAACLCVQNEECGSPDLCFCGVLPAGRMIDMSGTDCDPAGQGWAQLVTGYPSQQVGRPLVAPSNCNSSLGFSIDVGIVRAFPISAQPMEDAEVVEAQTQQMTDMVMVLKAIMCCQSLKPKDFILGTYTPLLAGDLLGGKWSLTVGLL